MDVKEILKLVANPLLTAGAAGYGMHWANRKYKLKLSTWLAGGLGVGVGYLIGKGLQSYLNGPSASQPVAQLPAQPGNSSELELTFAPQVQPLALPQGPAGPSPAIQHTNKGEPAPSHEELGQHGFGFQGGGSFSGTGDGLGSFESDWPIDDDDDLSN